MNFYLHVVFNEDGEPVEYLRERRGVLERLTQMAFDTLVLLPECRRVELHTLDMEDEDE